MHVVDDRAWEDQMSQPMIKKVWVEEGGDA